MEIAYINAVMDVRYNGRRGEFLLCLVDIFTLVVLKT